MERYINGKICICRLRVFEVLAFVSIGKAGWVWMRLCEVLREPRQDVASWCVPGIICRAALFRNGGDKTNQRGASDLVHFGRPKNGDIRVITSARSDRHLLDVLPSGKRVIGVIYQLWLGNGQQWSADEQVSRSQCSKVWVGESNGNSDRLPPVSRTYLSPRKWALSMTRRRWYFVDFTTASQRPPKCGTDDGVKRC